MPLPAQTTYTVRLAVLGLAVIVFVLFNVVGSGSAHPSFVDGSVVRRWLVYETHKSTLPAVTFKRKLSGPVTFVYCSTTLLLAATVVFTKVSIVTFAGV
jgi:hypothetical protein